MFSLQTIAASYQQGCNNGYKCVCTCCRWVAGPWSECSASCGRGFRHRQLSCHQAKANGSELALLPGACTHRDRPVGRKPCTGHSCPGGPAQAKTQVSYCLCLASLLLESGAVSSCHWLDICPLVAEHLSSCTREKLCGCNYLSDQSIRNPAS